jgi:hypothetical protein
MRRKRKERYRNLRRRVRDSPLDLRGEQHELLVLPKGTLKTFSGDGMIDAKIHVDCFWMFVISILSNMMM